MGTENFCSSHPSITHACTMANQQTCGCVSGMAPIVPMCGAPCFSCPAGSFCTGLLALAENCTTPTPGSYCGPASTANVGIPCPRGYYCTGGSAPALTCSCSPGYYSGSMTSNICTPTTGSCMPCPGGSACAGAAAQPVLCGPGTFAQSMACMPCPVSMGAVFPTCASGPASESSTPIIIGVTVGGVILAAIAIMLWRRQRRANAAAVRASGDSNPGTGAANFKVTPIAIMVSPANGVPSGPPSVLQSSLGGAVASAS